MWINTNNNKKAVENNDDKPHLSDLCEACQLGKCKQNRTVYRWNDDDEDDDDDDDDNGYNYNDNYYYDKDDYEDYD